MATHPTFYVGRLKRYHDPLGLPSRNSAVNAPVELSSLTTQNIHILTKDLKGPWLAVLSGSLTANSKPKGDLDHIHEIPKLTDLSPDLKLRVQKDTAEKEPRIQTPVALWEAPAASEVLTTQNIHILTKDLKGPWLAVLSGSLTANSKPKGDLDHIHEIPKLTDLVA
ncbi:Hypothetical protein PHPALM_18980 [Phytophthora palmivora]|uniref:Pol protein n=1 Tax=Phytophthora palmivora TaxID=4796 RepID=A0A2P4XIF1_9STRA|nr:Hypothetical protein PHPALM_18980 [Phytophthora palmivora]